MRNLSQNTKAPIVELGNRLASMLEAEAIPAGLKKEDKLERGLVLLEVEKLRGKVGPKVEVCAHPWRSKERCPHHKGTLQQLGCPKCWKESKPWASVHIWGMQHNFDLAIRDRQRPEDSLVVETKLVSFENGQPNSEIQRFFGQCGLARTKHKFVIGFCAYRGTPKEKFWQDTRAAIQWFKGADIRVIFRKID